SHLKHVADVPTYSGMYHEMHAKHAHRDWKYPLHAAGISNPLERLEHFKTHSGSFTRTDLGLAQQCLQLGIALVRSSIQSSHGISTILQNVADRVGKRCVHGGIPERRGGMPVLVQVSDGLCSRPALELASLGRDTEARGHMETVAHVPVDLDIGVVDPEILDVFLGGSDILALGGHHFCPAAKERGRLALGAHCREGN